MKNSCMSHQSLIFLSSFHSFHFLIFKHLQNFFYLLIFKLIQIGLIPMYTQRDFSDLFPLFCHSKLLFTLKLKLKAFKMLQIVNKKKFNKPLMMGTDEDEICLLQREFITPISLIYWRGNL